MTDSNHTPDNLEGWFLELSGVVVAHDINGDPIPGYHPTPELVDRLSERLMDHWFHAGHYHWYHHLAHRLNAPLWVHRLIHCRRCEHDIAGSAQLVGGEMSVTIWFDREIESD